MIYPVQSVLDELAELSDWLIGAAPSNAFPPGVVCLPLRPPPEWNANGKAHPVARSVRADHSIGDLSFVRG